MEVLAARVRCVDPAGVRRGVPVVDRRVELHAGVGALPRGLRDLVHEVARLDRLDDLAGGHCPQVPVGVVDDRLHERVGDPHRVVGVLVLRRVTVATVEVHVEAGIAQHACLALLDRLAPDEVRDVRMVGVEDHHLGGAPRPATRLDRAGRRVGAPHEAHRSGCGAATLQPLLRRPDRRQIDAGTRPALEDRAFLDVPVEDRLHLVFDREDEAGAGLLRLALDADVEPHRGVERCLLVDEQVLQLDAERPGLRLVDEVAVLVAPRGDGVDDAVDDLAQRRLTGRRAEMATEVLLGDDVRRVERPRRRELHVGLLEGHGAVPEVADPGIAPLPCHRVVGVRPRLGEVAADADAGLLRGDCHATSVLPG